MVEPGLSPRLFSHLVRFLPVTDSQLYRYTPCHTNPGVCQAHPHTFAPSTHTDAHTFTGTLTPLTSAGSHLHAPFFTQLRVFTHTAPSVIHTPTQAFSCSRAIPCPSQGAGINTGPGSPGVAVTQPPVPCPMPRAAAFRAEWCPRPCQAGWEGHRLAGAPPCRAGWALPGGQGGVPAPQLGVRRVSPPPRLPAPGSGQTERVLSI